MRRLLAVLLFVPVTGFAQEKKGANYAFLVSCGEKYNKVQLHPLPKSFRDMDDYRKALLKTGFEEDNIIFLHDDTKDPQRYLPEKDKILNELKLLLEGIKPADSLIVAINGHGLHFKGDKTSYFCPLNAKIDDKSTMIPMDGKDGLFTILQTCKARRKLLIAGACRNDPAKTSQAAEKVDLDLIDPDEVPEGIAALYSCKTGQKTYFEEKMERSYFFDHLVRAWQGEYHPSDENISIEAIFDKVCEKTTTSVRKAYGVSQVPEMRREYKGDPWVVSRLGARPASIPNPRITSNDPKPGEEREFEVFKGVRMRFCWVPADKAMLGSPASEKDRDVSEKERLFATRGFWMGKHEVTREEYASVTGATPVDPKNGRLPADRLSWDDCQKFLAIVNASAKANGRLQKVFGKTGKFVLPSEDEWEYACRGGKGNNQAYYVGNELTTELAAIEKNETSVVGSFASKAIHPWGLWDMHGNVWEWCENKFSADDANRVLRGGAAGMEAKFGRSAARRSTKQTQALPGFGFRVCYRFELLPATVKREVPKGYLAESAPEDDLMAGGHRISPVILRPVTKDITLRFKLVESPENDKRGPLYVLESKMPTEAVRAFAEANPGKIDSVTLNLLGQGDMPAMMLTAGEAGLVADWLGGRLPTPDEWDTAAGAYSHTPGIDSVATDEKRVWINRKAPQSVADVNRDQNMIGLFDLAGNGREWTGEMINPEGKREPVGKLPSERTLVVLRGRSFASDRALRYSDLKLEQETPQTQFAGYRSKFTGFRIVLDLQNLVPAQ